MESDKTTKPPRNLNTDSSLQFELQNIQTDASTNGMNRYRRNNSMIQPGTLTADGAGTSQKRSPFRTSLRSDTVSSLDQTFVSFRDVDSAKRHYHRRLRSLSSLSSAMGILAVIFAILDIEVTRMRLKRITESNNVSNSNGVLKLTDDSLGLAGVVLKGMISLLSVLTCVTLYKIYMTTRKLYVVKNLYHESESFLTSSLLFRYCAETIICLIHVPPLVDNLGVRYIYKLQLLVLLRLYLVTRCVKERSQLFNNQSTNLLASITKTDISSRFLVKLYFLKEPFMLIFTFYTLNVFLGGYSVYIIEDAPPYLDVVWMMVVTMTTLGFGDVVPHNVFARGLVGFASVLGIFLMALFISVVHETLQLTQQEKRILAYIENAEHLRKKKDMAARCVQSCWRYRSFIKRHGNAIEIGDWFKLQRARFLQHKFFETMRQWRTVRRAWTRDDYWKKFFVIDDTAMLLTDVCRTINNIERQLGMRHGSKGSKNSLYRNPSIYSPLPKKQDTQECDRIFEYPSISFQTPLPSPCGYHANSVQAVLVDSWKSPAEQQQQQQLQLQQKEEQEKRDKPVIQVETQRAEPQLLHNLENLPSAGQEDTRTRRCLLRRPDFLRKASDISTSSDHIDRGAMPLELLQTRIDSVENSLDQIYGKVKGELRDIRDAIKTLAASTTPGPRTPLWSPAITTRDGEHPRPDPIFSYANIEKYDI